MTFLNYSLLCATITTLLLHRAGRVAAATDVDIFNILVQNYETSKAPYQYGTDYVPVEASSMIESVLVEEYTSRIVLKSLLQLTWPDPRLRYRSNPAGGGIVISHSVAGLTSTPRLWLPSLAFPDAQVVDLDNSMDNFFLIRPNGTVSWQRRLILTLPCDLQLNSFPWDQTTCRSTIRQDLSREVLMLNWSSSALRPVFAGPNLSIRGFYLTQLLATYRRIPLGGSTDKSLRTKALMVAVTFRRIASYYIISDIVPTVILVMSAYLTFWLKPNTVVIRGLLASFMLLACFIVSALAGRAAPPVALTKALDIWNFVCLFFLLWALVQSLVVYRISLRKASGGKRDDDVESADLPPPNLPPVKLSLTPEDQAPGENGTEVVDVDVDAASLPPPPPEEQDLGPLPPRPSRRRRRRRLALSAGLLDRVSRGLYPLLFFIATLTMGLVFSS